jgi:ataxin-10
MDALLQSCALDASSPLAREWALWGVRNACEASADARAYVASLEASGVVSSPELARAGLAVELDRRTGKARVVKTSEGQQNEGEEGR